MCAHVGGWVWSCTCLEGIYVHQCKYISVYVLLCTVRWQCGLPWKIRALVPLATHIRKFTHASAHIHAHTDTHALTLLMETSWSFTCSTAVPFAPLRRIYSRQKGTWPEINGSFICDDGNYNCNLKRNKTGSHAVFSRGYYNYFMSNRWSRHVCVR